MNFQCAECSRSLIIPEGEIKFNCEGCGMRYAAGKDFLRYYPHQLLLDRFAEKYLRNRVLNNNAEIVYQNGQGGSLSTEDRDDVAAFSRFVSAHVTGRVLLDIGCGPLPLPGYLRSPKEAGMEIIGIDPIPARDFGGFRIVGCSEFMPLPPGSVDTAIFATSLDHVVDLDTTIKETRRVLRRGGRVIIWMGDQGRPWWRRTLSYLKSRFRGIFAPFPAHRYKLFPPDVVVYVPAWAVDPFHSFHESPRFVTQVMERYGFRRAAYDYRAKDEVFMCFEAS